MNAPAFRNGGVTLARIDQFADWEARILRFLRLWCDDQSGQDRVRQEFERAFPSSPACEAFARLVCELCTYAQRPLVRHEFDCTSVGSDECIFLHLVRTASEGHLGDAALIGGLLVGPAHAERIALLAGEVGWACRQMPGVEAPPSERTSVPIRNRLN